MALPFLVYRKLDCEMLSKCQVFPETICYVNCCFWKKDSLLCLKETAKSTMILKCYRALLQNKCRTIGVQSKYAVHLNGASSTMLMNIKHAAVVYFIRYFLDF